VDVDVPERTVPVVVLNAAGKVQVDADAAVNSEPDAVLQAMPVVSTQVQIIVPSAHLIYVPLEFEPRSMIEPVGTPPDSETVPDLADDEI